MKIEFALAFRRVLALQSFSGEKVPQLQCRPPRIARLVALAHKLDALVRARSPATLNSRGWVTFRRRDSRKSWFCCIWRHRFRNTFCFSPQLTLGSSPS
jgi:hypothetical protein